MSDEPKCPKCSSPHNTAMAGRESQGYFWFTCGSSSWPPAAGIGFSESDFCKIRAAHRENAALRKLIEAQTQLLTAYRLHRQPSGNTLDTIARLKQELGIDE